MNLDNMVLMEPGLGLWRGLCQNPVLQLMGFDSMPPSGFEWIWPPEHLSFKWILTGMPPSKEGWKFQLIGEASYLHPYAKSISDRFDIMVSINFGVFLTEMPPSV